MGVRPRNVTLGKDIINKRSKGNYYIIPGCLSNKCWEMPAEWRGLKLI